MAFTDLRKVGSIATAKGSDRGVYCEVDTTQANYTLTGGWKSLPYIANSSRGGEESTEDQETEGGTIIALTGTTKRTLNLTFMQQDVATKRFIEKELKGKTIAIVKEEHMVEVDGQYQYAVYPLCKTAGSFTRNAKSIETETVFNIQNNSVEIGIALNSAPISSSGQFQVTLSCNLFSIAANEGYDIYSQASA